MEKQHFLSPFGLALLMVSIFHPLNYCSICQAAPVVPLSNAIISDARQSLHTEKVEKVEAREKIVDANYHKHNYNKWFSNKLMLRTRNTEIQTNELESDIDGVREGDTVDVPLPIMHLLR